MKKYIIFSIALFLFVILVPYFAENVRNRPIYEKLGYLPQGKIYRAILGEFRWFAGDYFTFKAIIYYGSKAQRMFKGQRVDVEYYNLYKTLETSVILNPYHEDTYYFAQAIFTWGLGRIKEVNSILKYVFKYRYWDYQLPFFLGFNYGYFLKDYVKAAEFFKKAAELSGIPFYATLSSRYFYKGKRVELGIIFLRHLIKNTNKPEIKAVYEIRLKALEAIYKLEKAVKQYQKKFGHIPRNLNELVRVGILKKIPKDPYGGRFFIDKKGQVRTTSNLATNWKKNGSNKN